MKSQTARWVQKAEADLTGARSLGEKKPPLHDLVCFLCQQSAEKYLKALLQDWDMVPTRTHDLVRLHALLLVRDASLRVLRRGLGSLSRYAVDFRYPGKSASKREARAALGRAEKVRAEVRARLGLPL